MFRKAVEAHPPRADAAPTVRWIPLGHGPYPPPARPLRHHRTVRRTGHRMARRSGLQVLTHQLAVLAPLAVPGEECAVSDLAARRPVDVARGFVRAVRRKDCGRRRAPAAG